MKYKLLSILAFSSLMLAACTEEQLDTAIETNDKANELLEMTEQKSEDFENQVEQATQSIDNSIENVEQSVEQATESVEQAVEKGIQESFIGDGIENVNGIVENVNETEQHIEDLLNGEE